MEEFINSVWFVLNGFEKKLEVCLNEDKAREAAIKLDNEGNEHGIHYRMFSSAAEASYASKTGMMTLV